jgi:hypothetical protein
VRTTDPADSAYPLGRPVPRPEPAPPKDTEVAPGVFRRADGKHYTAKPQNEAASMQPIWDFFGIVATPISGSGDMEVILDGAATYGGLPLNYGERV